MSVAMNTRTPKYCLTEQQNRLAARQVYFNAEIARLRHLHDKEGIVQNLPAFTSPKARPKGMPLPLLPRGTMIAFRDDEHYDDEYSRWLTLSIASYTEVSQTTAVRRVNPEIWRLCPPFAQALVDLATDPNIDNYVNNIVHQLYATPEDAEVQQITMADDTGETTIGGYENVRPACPINEDKAANGPTVFTTHCLV